MDDGLRDHDGDSGYRIAAPDPDHREAPPEHWAGLFRSALALYGRSGVRSKWYFVWVRGFAAFLSGKPLRLAGREEAEGYLAKLSSSNRMERWQVEQAADALKILLGGVFGQDWTGSIRLPDPHPPPDVPVPSGNDPIDRLRYALRSATSEIFNARSARGRSRWS